MLRIPRTRVYHNRTKKKAQAGLLSEDATWTWDVDVWMKTYMLEYVGMLIRSIRIMELIIVGIMSIRSGGFLFGIMLIRSPFTGSYDDD
jgi:hypothetical protein